MTSRENHKRGVGYHLGEPGGAVNSASAPANKTSTGLLYRTPADVRAIPNEQWERWLRGQEHVSPTAFSSEASCQMALRYVAKAHQRRIEART